MKKWTLMTSTLVMLTLLTGCSEESSTKNPAPSYRYQPGQIWTYHTRPDEEESRAIVLRVDSDQELGHVIHIRIEGVFLEHAKTRELLEGVIGHMPFSQDAMDKSLIDLVSNTPIQPEDLEGYHIWTQAHTQGKASVFTAPIADQISELEKLIIQ